MTARPPLSAVLRYADFRNYLFAGALASVAAEMQSLAIGWQVYQLTGSFAQLGFIGLAQFAPFTLLVLLAGQVADRHDRGRIATACVALQAAGSALLVAFAHSGTHRTWPVYVVLVLFGTARAFAMPAASAMVINLVPAQAFHSAAAVNSSVSQVASIAGPVLGGCATLIVLAAWARLFPALRSADGFPSQPRGPQPES